MPLLLELIGTESALRDSVTVYGLERDLSIETLEPGELHDLRYRKTQIPFESVWGQLKLGQLSAIALRPSGSAFSYALIQSPGSIDSNLSHFSATFEFRDSQYFAFYLRSLTIKSLIASSVSAYESIELADKHLNPNSFPWKKSNLVIGGIRYNQHWIVDTGAYFEHLELLDAG